MPPAQLLVARPTDAIVHVEIDKSTFYFTATALHNDPGQDSNKFPRPTSPAIGAGIGIGDIASVNGQPVKGTAVETIVGGIIRPDCSPGTPNGDFPANNTGTS
jgi:hypothetical protein